MNKVFTAKYILAGLLFFILASCKTKNENSSSSQNDEPKVDTAFSVQNKKAFIYTTADSTNLRLTNNGSVEFSDASQPVETQESVFVNPQKRFQKFIGIGGALTDASAEVFAKLPIAKQQELIKAYYDPINGIGYTLGRTNIQSCDFSSESYSYVSNSDSSLSTFSIAHDLKYKIPLIKKVIAATGGKLRLFASPWSPPAFMKSNHNVLNGGKLLPAYYSSWALFYAKFVKAYANQGIPIWGITIQNEPMAKQTWESCIYTAQEERDFLKNYLGPTMHKQGLSDVKIMVWDHNRDLMGHRANVIFGDPEATKYAWGMAYHWYETWSGGKPMNRNVGKVHEAFPGKHLLFSEGCNERFDPNKLQDWAHGERYGRQMIKDFNEGTEGWTDWNILLNMQGGPNHVGNYCFAPVHANLKTGELIYTPAYYYIGQFSKFIQPGAQRVSDATSRSSLLSCSFLNPDGSLATVVMNQSDKGLTYGLYVGKEFTEVKIPAHAIQTLVIK